LRGESIMKRRLFLVAIVFSSFSASIFAEEKPASQWLVVTAPAFRPAIEALVAHRQAEGMRVTVVQTTDVLSSKEILNNDSQKLGDQVRKLCRDWKGTSYVLLVGAIENGNLTEPEKKMLPALPGAVGRMRGQPSDNGYGCLNGDKQPTVAVGRLPARSEDEAKQMVAKILASERDTRPGEWRQQITVLAGVPAFNPFVDKMVEGLAMSRFARLDPRWTGRAIYHNPASRFCVPDEQLHDKALAYVQAGQAITLYLGHSWAQGLYAPNGRFLDRKDWAELKIAHGPGIFATFGCNGCQLSGPEGEGYGVAALRNPNGPVAVMGSHGICFAAMCQLGADGILDSIGNGKLPERLADVWLKLKEGLAKGKIDDLTFKLLDSVDGDAKIPQATQRQEHLEMFVLLGDPALKLPRIADSMKLQVQGKIEPGGTIAVSGMTSEKLNGGRVRLTLERPVTGEPLDMKPLPVEAAERAKVMRENHERANRFVLQEDKVPVKDGHFEMRVRLPDKLPWPKLVLRAYAATDKHEALGVLVLDIAK
jgi:hypothetical protein